MNTRAIAAEYRLAHWTQVIQEQKASGLSIKAFCKSFGFHENIYFYWQRKLRKAACSELQSAPVTEVKEYFKTNVPSGWALCENETIETKQSSIAIEIGSCRVTATVDVDQELLAKVCRVLAAIC